MRAQMRDIILYILISFALLGMVFVFEGHWGHDAFIKWGGLAGFTAALFGQFISDSRPYIKLKQFWLMTSILLIAHLMAFVTLLMHVREWRLMWFAVMIFEYPILILLRSRYLTPS